MDDRRRSPIGALSGGQLQRTLLGRALIANPEVVVLDEPLSYIDKRFESHLYDIIADYARHSTIILVSHEMTTISQMASRHIIVDKTLHDCKAAGCPGRGRASPFSGTPMRCNTAMHP